MNLGVKTGLVPGSFMFSGSFMIFQCFFFSQDDQHGDFGVLPQKSWRNRWSAWHFLPLENHLAGSSKDRGGPAMVENRTWSRTAPWCSMSFQVKKIPGLFWSRFPGFPWRIHVCMPSYMVSHLPSTKTPVMWSHQSSMGFTVESMPGRNSHDFRQARSLRGDDAATWCEKSWDEWLMTWVRRFPMFDYLRRFFFCTCLDFFGGWFAHCLRVPQPGSADLSVIRSPYGKRNWMWNLHTQCLHIYI